MINLLYKYCLLTLVSVAIIGTNGFTADLPQCLPHICPKPKLETCTDKARKLVPIDNTIESALIVQLGTKKDCFIPDKVPFIVNVGAQVEIFVRNVYNDNLFNPLAGRAIKFSVIDSFGTPFPTRSMNDYVARTKNDGFADRQLAFTSYEMGVYRIKIEYLDRDIWNAVLTPNIIVIGETVE